MKNTCVVSCGLSHTPCQSRGRKETSPEYIRDQTCNQPQDCPRFYTKCISVMHADERENVYTQKTMNPPNENVIALTSLKAHSTRKSVFIQKTTKNAKKLNKVIKNSARERATLETAEKRTKVIILTVGRVLYHSGWWLGLSPVRRCKEMLAVLPPCARSRSVSRMHRTFRVFHVGTYKSGNFTPCRRPHCSTVFVSISPGGLSLAATRSRPFRALCVQYTYVCLLRVKFSQRALRLVSQTG